MHSYGTVSSETEQYGAPSGGTQNCFKGEVLKLSPSFNFALFLYLSDNHLYDGKIYSEQELLTFHCLQPRSHHERREANIIYTTYSRFYLNMYNVTY